jgi:pantetheine-phosphate adenylyltransferase
MSKILFPGTFDPFTIGHLSIVNRALLHFDEIIIGIGNNMLKKTFFPVEKRVAIVEKIFANEPRVSVMSYENLTVDFAKEINIDLILRGIRTVADFEYERSVADTNRSLTGVETIMLFTETQYSFISSSIVRELLTYGKDVSKYVPDNINLKEFINKKSF